MVTKKQMIYTDILAYMATALNLVMLTPQVLRTIRTKHTKDLSLATLTMFLTACMLWTLYGVAKSAAPIVIANVSVGVMNLILIVYRVRYY